RAPVRLPLFPYTTLFRSTAVIKPTEFKEDEILFSAWSPGGTSLYDAEDDVSADFAATIMSMSGIAGFDKITLGKMLSDKVFSLRSEEHTSELQSRENLVC